MNKPFAGKTAIVTGASSGIGRATAMTLSSMGAAVVLHARRQSLLDEVAENLIAQGGKALTVVGDAGCQSDLQELIQQVLAWDQGGRTFDIVVANAGRGLAGGLLSSDESQWESLYQTNVLGTAHLLRLAGEHLAKKGSGDLIVVGSVAGHNISPFSGFYGSSKFAVGALAEALRRELCGQGVRVSTVLPGIVTSGFQKVAGYTPKNFDQSIAHYGRVLEPQDIADGIAWLLSRPSHVHVSDITIRPTGQDYP